MAQMDDMMEQLILGREVKYFSENEDTCLANFSPRQGVFMRSTERRRKEKSCSGIRSAARSATGASDQYAIANIKMYSEFLREDSLTTEEYRHFADNLDRQARKLSWLGEGFAKISRMETGLFP